MADQAEDDDGLEVEAPEAIGTGKQAGPDEQPEAEEAKASRTGWRPKDEYVANGGDPEKWVDAKAFNQRGETNAATVRQLEKANAKLSKEIAEIRATTKEFGAQMTARVKQEYERAMADLKAQAREAAEDGNADGVDAITDQIADLSKKMEAEKKPNGTATEDQQAYDAFRAANPWFDTDPIMKGAAIALADQLTANGMSTADQMAEIPKRIRAEFPHKFENPRRKDAAAVEGAPGRDRGKGEKTFNDLPADAKTLCLRWERAGLMPRAEYIKDYFTQEPAR